MTATANGRQMHHQRFYACPERGDGHSCDGIAGDCLRTAVACVVGVDPDEVTHYALYADWWSAMRREAREQWAHDWAWLDLRDVDQITQGMAGGWRWTVGEHLVAVDGRSPRGDFTHVVVGRLTVASTDDGAPIALQLVHDPHPLGLMLREVYGIHVRCQPYDPAPSVREVLARCSRGSAS